MNFINLFQGIGPSLFKSQIAIARIILIFLGILLVYLGKSEILEPLIMIPMGFGMAAVNSGVLFLSASQIGTIFMDPMVSNTDQLINILQIDWLQPIYTFMFSNGLIACLVFMGIGVISDVGSVLKFPFTGMLIAMCAELGTVATFPIAHAMGFTYGEAAAISLIGGADGPMVLFASLALAKDLFVPITIVAYLYLSLTYGGYPFLVRFMIPKDIRGLVIKSALRSNITSNEKLAFDIIACIVLCLLFPSAAPLFLSFSLQC